PTWIMRTTPTLAARSSWVAIVSGGRSRTPGSSSTPTGKWVWLSMTALGSGSGSGNQPRSRGLTRASRPVGEARELAGDDVVVELGEDGARLGDGRPHAHGARGPRRRGRVVAGDDRVAGSAVEVLDLLEPGHGRDVARAA